MSLNGIRSTSPDTIYIKQLEDIIKDLRERIGKLEKDNKYLIQRVNK
jgi:hypothetical protein